MFASARAVMKSAIGPQLTVLGRCVLRGLPVPRWGNLRRVEPFSANFGVDRGTPVDRFYVDGFFDRHRDAITGRVLEVQLTTYTRRYGHDVTASDTVDINPRFAATYTCDLADAPQIPDDSYDCLLAPQTLQHVADLDGVLRTMLRVVRPGGYVLASAAALMPLTGDVDDNWRLSPAGWRKTLSRVWAGHHVEIEGHGNCLAAIAAMHGLALEELDARELLVNDARYPVVVTIACRK